MDPYWLKRLVLLGIVIRFGGTTPSIVIERLIREYEGNPSKKDRRKAKKTGKEVKEK